MVNLKRIFCCTLYYYLALGLCNNLFAQINLQCDANDRHAIYLVGDSAIYKIENVDSNPSNPVWQYSLPNHSQYNGGISINQHLDASANSQTMYFIDYLNIYYFWNGSGWANTGNSGGGSGAVNPGGTNNYIFNLDATWGTIFRYQGNTNAIPLISGLPTAGAVYDVATDSSGNFYLFYTGSQEIIAYNPSGMVIDSFSTSGFAAASQCGFAILGNRMYALNCNQPYGLYEGIITGNQINFTLIKTLSAFYGDIASCPNAAFPLGMNKNREIPRTLIYPNPSGNRVNIELDRTDLIEIRNCMGELEQSIITKGLTEYQLDVSGWKAGVYFIHALSKDKTSSRTKLIVQ